MKKNTEKLFYSFLPGALLVTVMWLIKLIEFGTGISLAYLGLKPGNILGLIGIFTMPFLHGNFAHLISNTLPFLFLSTLIFYFYAPSTKQLFPWLFLATGLWTWLFARPSYHIGASGLVYGMASFIFFSGVLRRDRASMALSFLVIFLYSSLLFGLFPNEANISWEGHLAGGVAGMIYAYIARKEGKVAKKYEWKMPEEPQDFSEAPLVVNYIYLPKNKKVSDFSEE